MRKKSVTVAFTLTLDESDFEKIYKVAKENGHDFEDAGPIETVRRHLVSDGTGWLEELIGSAALIVSTQTHSHFIKEMQK